MDLATKPDPLICPRKFCFHWQLGELTTVDTPVPSSATQGCLCPFGVCTRLDSAGGDRDWYEPHEPNLAEAGLPWFFFIPTPAQLRAEFRARYHEESEALWGREPSKAKSTAAVLC